MTVRGTLVLLVAAVAVAITAALPALFLPAAGLFVLVMLAVVVDSRRAPGRSDLTARREHDPVLSVGAKNAVRVTVTSRRPGVVARVADEHPGAFLSDNGAVTLQLSGSFTYSVTPRARGEARFGSTVVRAPGPWGLGFRQTRLGDGETVKIDADLSAISEYQALARRGQLAEIGVRAQRRRAEGTEFERVRDAVPDDPLRFINWRATARTGRLMATEFRPERAQPVIICMDHARLMGVGAGALTKLDLSVNAAVLLAHVALSTGDKVGLFAFADKVTAQVSPQAGTAQLRRILDALRPLHPGGIEADYDDALLRLSRWHRRRALLVIFTDVLDPSQSESLLRQCARLRRRHLPLVITVRDPAVDDAAHAAPSDTRTTYERAIAASMLADREAALAILRVSGIDTIDADVRTLSPRLVNHYLEMKRTSRL